MKKKLLPLSILAITLFLFTCQSKKVNTSESDKDAYVSLLNQLKFEMCDSCLMRKDVQKYESGLGSHKLDLSIDKLARAFSGADWYFDTTFPLFPGYKSEIAFVSDVRGPVEEYEAYLRPKVNDSLPRFAILYKFSEHFYDFRTDSLEISEWTGKWFYSDPILDEFTGRNENGFRLDTLYWEAMFSAVSRMVRGYLPNPEPYLDILRGGNRFCDDLVFREAGYYYFTKSVNDGSRKSYFEKAPYLSLCGCNGWTMPQDDNLRYQSRGALFKESSIYYCMAWAASHWYYAKPDTSLGPNRYYFDVEPKDIAIYITQDVSPY